MATDQATSGRRPRSPRRLILTAVAMASAAVVMAFPAAASADSTTPTFTLTPATGPAGTHVTITGQLSATQLPVWVPMLKAPEIFTLLTDISASCEPTTATPCAPAPTGLVGCELLDGAVGGVIHVEESTGAVTGSFIVGTTGTCVQSTPDAASHVAPPGRYALSVGCPACEVGAFTLTAASAAPTLPAAGFPSAPAMVVGVVLIAAGLLLRRFGAVAHSTPRG
ncbi:MAG TPA: hypothetical protein VIL94_03310 [Acidothermaceae bacterium]